MQHGWKFAGRMITLAAVITVVALPSALADAPTMRVKREAELRATETAFAKTMADRDHAAFAGFISDEAVFFGRAGEIRGKDAIVDAWASLFEGAQPPFSWRPEVAVVPESSHDLGFTSGPVFNPDGKQTGTFNSVWRRESNGKWKIVFDKGCPPCGSP
jgi:ketosteroid isomerase-like protein